MPNPYAIENIDYSVGAQHAVPAVLTLALDYFTASTALSAPASAKPSDLAAHSARRIVGSGPS